MPNCYLIALVVSCVCDHLASLFWASKPKIVLVMFYFLEMESNKCNRFDFFLFFFLYGICGGTGNYSGGSIDIIRHCDMKLSGHE